MYVDVEVVVVAMRWWWFNGSSQNLRRNKETYSISKKGPLVYTHTHTCTHTHRPHRPHKHTKYPVAKMPYSVFSVHNIGTNFGDVQILHE